MKHTPVLFAALLLSGLSLPLLAQPRHPYHIDFNPQQDMTLLDRNDKGEQGFFIRVTFTITLEGKTSIEDLAGQDYKIKIEEDGHFIPPELDVPRPTPVENLSAVLALDTSGSMKERNR